MFSKNIFVFGLLAIFACQAQAADYTRAEIDHRIAFGITDTVKDFIKKLNSMISDLLGGALDQLSKLFGYVTDLKKKFIDDGIAIITKSVQDVIDFITTKTTEAIAIGVDISKCTFGKIEEATKMGVDLTAKLTKCVASPADRAMELIKKDIDIVKDLISDATKHITKLSKCGFPPSLSCANTIIQVTAFISNIPFEISDMISEVTGLISELPTILMKCVTDIRTESVTKSKALIKELDVCIQKIFDDHKSHKMNFKFPAL